jgi:general secretion pathway protein C
MQVDSLVRAAALGVIPVVGVTAYLVLHSQSRPSTKPAPAASVGAPLESAKPEAEATAEPSAEPSSQDETALRVIGDRVIKDRLSTAPLPKRLMAAELPSASVPVAPPSATVAPNPGACGGIVLKAVTSSGEPSWSSASLSPSPTEPAVVRHVGERINNWRIQSIDGTRVWLVGASERCAVEIHPGLSVPEGKARGGRSRKATALLGNETPEWEVPAEIVQGIEKRSETEYSLLTRTVDAIFARGAALMAGLRIEPVRRNGSVVGIELDLVPAGSLLERLGIESGDVLLAVNEEPSPSPQAAVAALGRARQQARMVARLERRGEPFDLEVEVH